MWANETVVWFFIVVFRLSPIFIRSIFCHIQDAVQKQEMREIQPQVSECNAMCISLKLTLIKHRQAFVSWVVHSSWNIYYYHPNEQACLQSKTSDFWHFDSYWNLIFILNIFQVKSGVWIFRKRGLVSPIVKPTLCFYKNRI